MGYEERTWAIGHSQLTPVYIWDAGNEVWEKYQTGELRHYRILSRTMNAEGTRIREVLERLEECAVPLEIYAKHIRTDMRWGIEKECEQEAEVYPQVWELSPLANWIPATSLYRDLSVG